MNIQNHSAKAKEKIFEAILEYAGACHVENIDNEADLMEKKDGKMNIPKELDANIEKLIARYHRKEKIRRAWNISKKTFYRAAVFLFIIIVSFSALVSNVEAVRVPFFNFVIEFGKEHTSINLKNIEETFSKDISDIPTNWENAYMPTYLPEDFQIAKTETLKFTNVINYKDDNGRSIIFKQMDGENVNMGIDTENAVSKKVSINDGKGLLVEKEGRTTLIWHMHDLLFSLMSGDVEKSILIRMAKSVEKY